MAPSAKKAVNQGLHRSIPYDTIALMTTADKILAGMRRNPLGWSIEKFKTVARHHHVSFRHKGTSHCVFVRKEARHCLSLRISRSSRFT